MKYRQGNVKKLMEKTLAILLIAIFVASSIFILPAYSDDGEQPTLFSVRQGANTWIVEPIQGSVSAVEFYNYDPNSGYAPYMEYKKSKVYLYEDPEGELSLIIHHNKAALPVVSFGLNMSIDGLPDGAYVALSDDSGEFYFIEGWVLGAWPVVSHNDSEGGVISGLQGKDWTITVYAGAAGAIDAWEWQTATGAIPLDLLMYPEPGPIVPVIISNNLLVNPGFENVEYGLTGWGTTEGSAVYSTDSSTRHSGLYSCMGVEDNSESLGRLYQDVTGVTSPGNQYQISGWIKTSGVTTGSVVIGLDYVDETGGTPEDGYVYEIGYVSGTHDWTFFQSDWFTLPPMPIDAEALWFLFDFNEGTGTAWFDDVSLKAISASEYALSITVNPPEGGTVTKDPDLETYPLGAEVELTAIANEGYTFVGWSGDLTGNATSAVLVIDEDPEVTATFKLNYIPPGEDITVYPDPNVVLTFDQVLTGGKVIVTSSDVGPPPPRGFDVGPYYYIDTDPLTFTTVAIGIHYDDTGLTPEQEAGLRLWRYDHAVPVKGDVDRNGKVDLKDLLIIILALGTKPGQKRWNPACDLNGDNKIDLKDLCIAVMNFRKRSTPAGWTNIAFEVDTVNNIVYGNTDHFSPYRVR